MPGQTPPVRGKKNHRPSRPLRVLLVDAEPQVHQDVAQCLDGVTMELIHASSLDQARRHLAKSSADLVLIASDQPDGDGLDLAGEIQGKGAVTQTIILSGRPTLTGAVEAIRAGAADFIAKPLNPVEFTERVDQVRLKHETVRQQKREVLRLRRVCRKLNNVRKEVAQQVDILCKDLVTAYQELAEQMNQVVQTSEFAGVIRQELDLEQLLRKTLEYLLQKVGPTNAAIFLPAGSDEYTLGGYVNYDCTSDSAEVLLQHLADVVAPRVAERGGPIHITDSATLAAWIGSDMALLTDSHMVAFTCWHEQEPLAVVILFRHESDTYDPGILEMSESIAPMLGEFLAKLIRIHHRHLDIEDGPEEDDGDFTWGNAA